MSVFTRFPTWLGIIAVAVAADAAPKIQFDQLTCDFSATAQVQQVIGKFTFRNAGDAELEVGKPKPVCGCTIAEIKPDRLAPGATGELNFTLNTGHYRGLTVKTIGVPTNDPQATNVTLTIRVDIKPTFDFEPATLMFGDMRAGTTTNTAILLKRADGKPLGLTNVVTRGEAFHARFEPVNDKEARLVIKVEASGPPRWLFDEIKGQATDAPNPAFSLLTYARVVGDVAASPEAVNWSLGRIELLTPEQREAALTRRIDVTSTKPGQTLEIRNLACDLKSLRLTLETVEPRKKYVVVAKIIEPPAQTEGGTITFETNIPDQPKVSVRADINVVKP